MGDISSRSQQNCFFLWRKKVNSKNAIFFKSTVESFRSDNIGWVFSQYSRKGISVEQVFFYFAKMMASEGSK